MAKRGNREGSIYRRADGRWAAALTGFDSTGRKKRFWYYGRTRAEVQTKLTDAQRAQARGQFLAGQPPTVEQYLTSWLNRLAGVRPTTRDSYEDEVRRLNALLGHHRLDRLRRIDVEDAYAILNAKYAPATVRRTHAVLHSALTDAVDADLLLKNPATRAQMPAVERKAMRVLTEPQLRQLLDVSRGTRFHALWMLMATAGLRPGEALALLWSDIDFAGRLVRVSHSLHDAGADSYRGPTKTASSRRTVPISQTMVAAFEEHRAMQEEMREAWIDEWQENDLVFPAERGALCSRSSIQRAIKRHGEQIGVPAISPHDLRHTFASLCFARGLHTGLVQRWMGHSSIAITNDVYSHLLPGMSETVAGVMDAILAGRPTLLGGSLTGTREGGA